MSARQYTSTAESTTLSTGINNSTTSIVLTSVSTFPVAYPYTLVIDPDTTSEEIVTVTASAGGLTLTATRGQDGTSGKAHAAGAVVKHMLTPRDLSDAQNHIEASSGGYSITSDGYGVTTHSLHGINAGEGSVVGTTKTQTLTNKTVALGSNTVSGTTAQFNASLTDNDFATLAGTESLSNKTLASPTLSGTMSMPTSTTVSMSSGATISMGSGALISANSTTVNDVEMSYLDGATSNIQTQVNNKQSYNWLINGGMDVFQRTGTTITSGNYAVDRWFVTATGAMSIGQTNTSAFPAPAGSSYAISASFSGSGTLNAEQALEQAVVQSLRGKTMTFSYWAQASSVPSAGTPSVLYSNSTDARASLTTPVTAVSTVVPTGMSTGTWYLSSVTFVVPTDAIGLKVKASFFGGGITSIYITNAQLELGSVATTFAAKPYSVELAACKRYFERFGNTGAVAYLGTGYYTSATAAISILNYQVEKRAVVTPTVTAPTSCGNLSTTGVGVLCTAVAFNGSNKFNTRITSTVSTGGASGQATLFYLGASSYIDIDAEL